MHHFLERYTIGGLPYEEGLARFVHNPAASEEVTALGQRPDQRNVTTAAASLEAEGVVEVGREKGMCANETAEARADDGVRILAGTRMRRVEAASAM